MIRIEVAPAPPQDPKLKTAPIPDGPPASPLTALATAMGEVRALRAMVEGLTARIEAIEARPIADPVGRLPAHTQQPATPKPWEIEGISRSLYFLRKKRAANDRASPIAPPPPSQ